jgi:hypothetical protein
MVRLKATNVQVVGKECNQGKLKHWVGPNYGTITKHFCASIPYKWKDVAQNKFVKDLALYVVKGYMPISTIENYCLRLFSVVTKFSCGFYMVFK